MPTTKTGTLILTQTRELLDNPANWTRGLTAVNPAGSPEPYDGLLAARWSLLAAVQRFGVEGEPGLLEALRQLRRAAARPLIDLAFELDHAQTLAVLDAALLLPEEPIVQLGPEDFRPRPGALRR